MTRLLPAGVARALDAASPRERLLVVTAALVVVLARRCTSSSGSR